MRQAKQIDTRWLAFAMGLIILLFPLIPFRSTAQTDKTGVKAPPQRPSSFEGCYDLKLSPWRPWGFGEENALVTPPSRIQLLGERGTRGFEEGQLLIRTIPRREGPPGARESSFWSIRSANQLLLTWTDGFVGVTIDLTKYNDEFDGWAHPHFDTPRMRRTAHVTAHRITCTTQ